MLNLHQNKSSMKGKEIQQKDCSSIKAIDETGDAQTHVTIDFSLFKWPTIFIKFRLERSFAAGANKNGTSVSKCNQ